MFYYDSNGYLKLATNDVGASANTFKDSLKNLPNIYNYNPTVSLVTLDALGNPTNVSASI